MRLEVERMLSREAHDDPTAPFSFLIVETTLQPGVRVVISHLLALQRGKSSWE